MAKMQIKRIGVFSFAKVYAVVLTGIGLLIFIPIGLIMMIFGAAAITQESGGAMAGVGIGLGLVYMVILPVVYGIIGFIFGAVTALIYNVAAGFVGGLELDLENVAPDYSAPPAPAQTWAQPPPAEQPPPYQSGQPY